MSGFSPDWLALREPFDAAARSATLCAELTRHLPETETLRVLDLGCGTGANLRYLAPRLARPQHWTLLDHDSALLGRVGLNDPTPSARADIHTVQLDLVTALDRVPWAGAHLVTASALLDLVSERWLAQVLQHIVDGGACALFALNYDGAFDCSPADPFDETVRRLFNRHQRGEKPFGPGLGPDAGERAAALLAEAGYTVTRAATPWHIGPDAIDMQRQLMDGWATAASEVDPAQADAITVWRQRRERWLNAGRSALTVGHLDIAAWPAP